MATVSLFGTVTASPASAASVIETTYRATGTWAVSTLNASSGGQSYVITYPTNLGQGGFNHPVITWGNGTNATPSQYTGILRHLASWGFVVVASTTTQAGYGTEMLAGVNYMLAQNNTSGSIFFQNLDPAKIGATGHSQGAGGALNATVLSNGVITSTLPLHYPNPSWVSPEHVTDFTRITRPIFFVTGSNDWLISTPSGQTGYYNQIAGAAAKATLRGAGHNAVQGAATGYLGYVNAWFMYTLRGDANARAAFVGNPAELPGNSNWANQATKNLP